MNRTRTVLLLCLFACGRGNPPPKPLAHIPLPSGALLDPYDASKPGEARPLYTAQLGGRVYATLSNINPSTFAPAGPGFLASVDRTTFAAADGADAGHPPIPVPCPTTEQGAFVPYVGIVNGDLYALCATNEAGLLARFDAQTGAAKGSVAVGAQPTEFAATGDGRIAVVNSIENTMTLVTPGATLSAQLALTFNSATATLQDVKARG